MLPFPSSLSADLVRLHLAHLGPRPFPSQAEPDATVPKEPPPAGRPLQPVPTGSEGGSQVGIALGRELVWEGGAWSLLDVRAEEGGSAAGEGCLPPWGTLRWGQGWLTQVLSVPGPSIT